MSRRRPSRFHGLLPVDKKAGPTSHDVVDLVRRALDERRVGHTGTLDPMAEGLLLMCIGRATRLQQFLLLWSKTYVARVRLGWSTDTYDAEGERTGPEADPPTLSEADIAELEAAFSGELEQSPPAYSAKKVGGKKLYELARSGEPVRPTPKKVTVHGLHLTQPRADELLVEATVSSGFYVRSLAHDIGVRLGCGGHLRRLERTRIGPFDSSGALPQSALEDAASPHDVVEAPQWVPLERIPLPFPDVQVNSTAADRFAHGQQVVLFRSGEEPLEVSSRVAVRCGSRLLGVGEVLNVLARGRTVNVKPALVLGE
jgi:tRNA pseudouridine55 synthase